MVPDYGRDNFVAHIESDIDHPTFGTLQGIVHEVIGPGGGIRAQFFGGTDTSTDALHCTDTVSTITCDVCTIDDTVHCTILVL